MGDAGGVSRLGDGGRGEDVRSVKVEVRGMEEVRMRVRRARVRRVRARVRQRYSSRAEIVREG